MERTMRRSQRSKTKLPTNLVEQVETAINEAKREIRNDWYATRGERDESLHPGAQPFRLLDLPPELRARIFSFAVAVDGVCDVLYRWRPTVTTASRQLRAESMPLFYAENTFTMPLIIATQG